jgi:hypothetical protein
MSKLNDEEFRKEKEVAYYSALISAWTETRMELDKSLLTLSAGGIGLLVTILSTVGINKKWVLFLYAGAFVSFLISVFSCLRIFWRNSERIASLVGNTSARDHHCSCIIFERYSVFNFDWSCWWNVSI